MLADHHVGQRVLEAGSVASDSGCGAQLPKGWQPTHDVGDFEYFDALNAELDNDGVENLGSWKPKFIYETRALLEQKQLHGLDAWIEALLQEGALPRVFSTKYPNRCLSADLLASSQAYDRYTNSTRVSGKLKLLNVEPINIETSRGWAFPPLLDCRKSWAARFGGEWIWHRDVRKSEALSHSNHSGQRLRCTP